MKEAVSVERAEQEFGITCPHELMENGELRFRLLGQDGNGYIRTVASSSGGWQNGHSDTAFRELYLVETGWMAMAIASRESNIAEISIYEAGETFVTPMGLVHNVCLPAHAVIHTINSGSEGRNRNGNRRYGLMTRPIICRRRISANAPEGPPRRTQVRTLQPSRSVGRPSWL